MAKVRVSTAILVPSDARTLGERVRPAARDPGSSEAQYTAGRWPPGTERTGDGGRRAELPGDPAHARHAARPVRQRLGHARPVRGGRRGAGAELDVGARLVARGAGSGEREPAELARPAPPPAARPRW